MAKDNKLKQRKVVNEDITQIRNLLILLIVVILICIGAYFLTNKLINKTSKKTETETKVEFNYDIATIGTMFNRPEKEYYVILYSNKDDSVLYNSLLTSYRSSDNYIKTYYVDLDLYENNKALKEELNKKPTNSNEVSVTGPTLYKIEKGKVTNCYSDYESMRKVFE